MTIAEVGRIASASQGTYRPPVESGSERQVYDYGCFGDALTFADDLDSVELDPRPDCEYGPCGDCYREHCPERAE